MTSRDEPFDGLFTQGMVCHETYKRERRQVAAARGGRARRRRQGRARLRQEPGRGRPLGEDVQVEEERRRPGPDHPRLRRRHRALVHAVGLAARARPRMDRSRRRGRLALPAAPVPHRQRRRSSRLPPAGTAKPAGVLRRRDRAAPRRAQDHRRRVGRHRGVPLQQGRGAALRARQRDRRLRGEGRRRPTWALREALEIFVRLIGPMTPHLAEELWQALGHTTLLADAPWPVAEDALLVDDTVTVAVQVNGKLRGTIQLRQGRRQGGGREGGAGAARARARAGRQAAQAGDRRAEPHRQRRAISAA